MNTDMWIFLFALWLMCVSSNGQPPIGPDDDDRCKLHPVRASLGSSVHLPCVFSTNGSSGVTWVHLNEMRYVDLINLSSNGIVKFTDPRHGRVKAFPNQARLRDFSIRVDELKLSDLGLYRCWQNNNCHEVELQEDKGEQSYEDFYEDLCETYSLRAPLGSSVLLPCSFWTNGLKWVTWAHNEMHLVRLSSHGHVKFIDPRHGRVKAFPNQAWVGNFAIRIDELKTSDLGSYRCKQRNKCFQVHLLAGIDANTWLLIFICVGVAAVTLLSAVGYFCCLKCPGLWNKRRDDASNPVSESTGAGPSAPPQESGPGPHMGFPYYGADNNSLVYENDDDHHVSNRDPVRNQWGPTGGLQHPGVSQPSQDDGIYPNLEEFKFERAESRRTKLRFHIELISRLRQASLNRHFYANQDEINKQKATKTRAQTAKNTVPVSECEYNNPIYNRSTDHLNLL